MKFAIIFPETGEKALPAIFNTVEEAQEVLFIRIGKKYEQIKHFGKDHAAYLTHLGDIYVIREQAE